MITLYGFGPAMGLPEISPFVTKAHILLRMAGIPYETNANVGGFLKAPKGKLPYISDDGAVVSDSTFIRFHIEKKYGFDFDHGLSRAEMATGWALERPAEALHMQSAAHRPASVELDQGPERGWERPENLRRAGAEICV